MITEFIVNSATYFTALCHPNSVQVHIQSEEAMHWELEWRSQHL